MTIQRITNHHSAPLPACLRAFVLAAETGKLLNSRPQTHVGSTANIGKLGMNTANIFTGGNADVTSFTQGNSALLRGSA